MRIISARVSAIVHATEDPEKVICALKQICGLELSRSIIEKRIFKGHFGNPITPLALHLRCAQAEAVLVSLWRKLSIQERGVLVESLTDRLDDEGKLHIRLDKQKSFRGECQFNERDPIKVQISFERSSSYPEVKKFLETLHV
jgi:RNA binding exosome subunit